MTTPKTIRIFLAEGKPTGIKMVELSNWNGKCYVIPRDSLKTALNRDELHSQAVYFLIGEDEEGQKIVYLGESEDFAERIYHHQRTKDFWQTTICFFAKDENLNKAHVKYLESLLQHELTTAGRAKVEIGKVSNKSKLSESDEAEVQEFASNIKFILSALGYTFLKKPREEEDVDEVFYCKGKGAVAKGALTSEGFVIFSGSTLSTQQSDSFGGTAEQFRQDLVKNGRVELDGNVWRLKEDIVVSSPSFAGGVVLARSNNGWTSWKTEDGRTLDEVKRKDI